MKHNWDLLRRQALIVLVVLAVSVAIVLEGISYAAGVLYNRTFEGQPSSPQAWQPTDWDVSIHSRDHQYWYALEPMHAHHGTDCAGFPATHEINSYTDAVFNCNNHIM